MNFYITIFMEQITSVNQGLSVSHPQRILLRMARSTKSTDSICTSIQGFCFSTFITGHIRKLRYISPDKMMSQLYVQNFSPFCDTAENLNATEGTSWNEYTICIPVVFKGMCSASREAQRQKLDCKKPEAQQCSIISISIYNRLQSGSRELSGSSSIAVIHCYSTQGWGTW